MLSRTSAVFLTTGSSFNFVDLYIPSNLKLASNKWQHFQEQLIAAL
jgi:hypothetical protein